MAGKTKAKNFMKVEDVTEKLEQGLKDIFDSGRYKEMLQTMSKFHNYSVNNTIMIGLQNPNATMVKGFKGWQELGRTVNKGENAIKILAPVIRDVEEKNKVTGEIEKVKKVIGFRMASVFDVSQTSGKEIPSVRDFINGELKNDEAIGKLYQDFKEHIQKEGKFNLKEQETESGVGGYYDRKTNDIVISTNENSNDAEKFNVLIHEYAHGKVHHIDSPYKDLPRGHKEAQAESVAYVVSNYYGLDTDDTSLGYIATWSKDYKLAQQAIKEIQGVSSEIIDVLDGLQKDKALQFYQEQEQQYDKALDNLEERFNIKLRDEEGNVLDNVKNHVFQVVDKETGNVYSARLVESNQGEQLVSQLGNNRITPITDFTVSNEEKGRFATLDLKVHDGYLDRRIYPHTKEGEIDKEYPRNLEMKNDGEERVTIKESSEGKYYVSLSDGKSDLNISSMMETKDQAQEFKRHFTLSEAINDRIFVEGEKQVYDSQNIKDYEVNKSAFQNDSLYKFEQLDDISKNQMIKSVQQHLSLPSNESIIKFEQAKAISYELTSNKHINSIEKFEAHLNGNTKHLPKMQRLKEQIEIIKSDLKDYENTNEKTNTNTQKPEKVRELELEM
jgi:N-terminal domain of anti-restriction factor ArdC